MSKDKTSHRILVIEDNPGDFTIVEDFLLEQISNPEIVHVVNYKQAADILHDDQAFTAILLDLSLPDKEGQELITEMLRLTSFCCPIIILTGYAEINFSIRSIGQGIMDYLLKDELTAIGLYKSIIYSKERKNNFYEIKASEKRFSDLFNLSPQPMWVFDVDTFNFVQVNKAALDLYGYSEAEFLNMTLIDIKLEEDVPMLKDNIISKGPAEGFFKGVLRHRKKSGDIIELEIYSTPIIMNGRNFRSVIAIDVTEKNLFEHKIVKAIIKTQEDERYEIGGELHDNVCQILAASQLNLGMIKDSLAPAGIPMYMQCKKNISLALDEIRNLSHRLAPAFFNDSTLEEAFRRLFNDFFIEKDVEIIVHFDEAVKKYPISLEIQLNLYRILQEQLRNILKYAKAGLIEVDVLIYNNKIKMKISDNGVGFNINKVKEGIGLANMKRRAELFSGKFELHSSPGKGCIIIIDIPLPEIMSAVEAELSIR